MIQGPPIVLRLSQVPAYMLKQYGIVTNVRTVQKWVRRGRGMETLQTYLVGNPQWNHRFPRVRVTTTDWVDEFARRTRLPIKDVTDVQDHDGPR